MKFKLLLALLFMGSAVANAEQVVVQTRSISMVLNVEKGAQPQYVYFGSRLNAADLKNLSVPSLPLIATSIRYFNGITRCV